MSNLPSQDEILDLREHLSQTFNKPVKDLNLIARDDLRKVLLATTEDEELLIHTTVSGVPSAILESEVATLDYLRNGTSIPVPRILQTHYGGSGVRPHIVLEKMKGINLESVWSEMEPLEHDLLVGQVARWMMELFAHRFPLMGSLYPMEDKPGEVRIGPIIQPLFYMNGRADYPLDRGPFSTVRDYLSGCAQRELDCSRFMFSQDTSKEYQERLQDEKINVERSMHLFHQLIERCPGLDSSDPELAPFSLDIHNTPLKNIIVDTDDHTRVISVEFFPLTTQPLWCCAQMPTWLSPSISGQCEDQKARWADKFRQTILGVQGYHSLFLRALEIEDTRLALHDVCRFNAFTDSFLLMPTLESIVATLPGEEDLEGLEALLDPSTLEGRVARIALTTKGPGVMSLAMPTQTPVKDAIVIDSPSSQYVRIDPVHFGSPPKGDKMARQLMQSQQSIVLPEELEEVDDKPATEEIADTHDSAEPTAEPEPTTEPVTEPVTEPPSGKILEKREAQVEEDNTPKADVIDSPFQTSGDIDLKMVEEPKAAGVYGLERVISEVM